MMKHLLIKVFSFLMAAVILFSCKDPGKSGNPNPEDLVLSWEFLGNNFSEGYSSAKFVLKNTGQQALGDNNWKIYFNQMGRGVIDESVSGGVYISHINGDLLCLSPREGFQLKPGNEVEIAYNKPGSLFKEAEAPDGFYIVFVDPASGKEKLAALENIQKKAFPSLDKIFPPESGIPVPDAEWVYRQNASLNIHDYPNRVIPLPVSTKYSEGKEVLMTGLVIRYQKGLENEAEYLANMLEKVMGTKPGKVPGSGSGTNLINLGLSGTEGRESYQLKVLSGGGIHVHGGDAAGVFYGIQSLLSILPVDAWAKPQRELEVDCVSVSDAPAFEYRGIMLDVARNYHQPEAVRKLIAAMGFYKLNKLHFSITNDEAWRLEIPGLPELTEVGAFRGHTADSKDRLIPAYGSGAFPDPETGAGSGFMSREDFIDLLKYAASFHVEIIPEINFPGHSRAAIKAMETRYDRLMEEGKTEEAELYRLADPDDKSVYNSAQNFDDNVSCVCKEAPFVFFEKVVDELIDMYKDAGLELLTLHTGGDEVPANSWTESPICKDFLKKHPDIGGPQFLQVYFEGRLLDILSEKGLLMAGWEEIAMIKDEEGKWMANPAFAGKGMLPFVWNSLGSMLDLGNRMANAGYPVVLCNVENFYMDLAYNHHPAEPGLYWGGFVNTRSSFTFAPFDVFNTTLTDRYQRPINPARFEGMEPLRLEARKNIAGLEGPIWSETIRKKGMLEYYYMPKMLGLAERAWSGQAKWGAIPDMEKRKEAINEDWSEFAYAIGHREMPRLDHLYGGFSYRLPAPGAIVEEGLVYANVDFPGLAIHYTNDGSEPGMDSPLYEDPFEADGIITLRSFDSRGRGSRVTVLDCTAH